MTMKRRGNAFLSNWLISEHWAVGLQKDMEGGIVEWGRGKACLDPPAV